LISFQTIFKHLELLNAFLVDIDVLESIDKNEDTSSFEIKSKFVIYGIFDSYINTFKHVLLEASFVTFDFYLIFLFLQ
jgi:hypothetical protein